MKKHGLTEQFLKLLFATGLFCVLLFFVLQSVTRAALLYYNEHSDIQQRSIEWQLKGLQRFVTTQEVAATDIARLSDWTNDREFVWMNIYRNHVVLYSNFSPESIGQRQNPKDAEEPWVQLRPVQFADGPAEVQIFSNLVFNWWLTISRVLMVVCVGVFLFVFWRGCRHIVQYICLLSEEIQAMEGGDLDHPITIRGNSELTTLASCLDSMRITLRRQQREEAESSAKVKNLITEMSHDLRTPLTTLLLYTEIVRGGRYQDEEQLKDYLNKIDGKARQLKQLSDNLFEYALVTRDTVVTLDPPANFSRIFEEPLAEMVDALQQRGFICALDLGTEDLMLTVKGQYIRRIFDNISSNIIKYADPKQDIVVSFVREENRVGLTFANGVVSGHSTGESTQVGLSSIETMMEKMNAETQVQKTEERFTITLLFPVA